jgi:uncharacterized protein (TIGR02145 family)
MTPIKLYIMRNKQLYLAAIILLILGLSRLQAQTDKATEPLTDIDNNVYKTVMIGKQIWMAENLKTSRYSNGDSIGTTHPDTLNYMTESTPKYQWIYAGNESNLVPYGRLYTWYTVTDSRKVCPTGWHVPSKEEWATLTKFLGGDSLAHGKLKETGIKHWDKPNTGATNESGFTGIPGGNHHPKGSFLYMGECGHWWSVTEQDKNFAWRLRLRNDDNIENFFGYAPKLMGWSVRCVKD